MHEEDSTVEEWRDVAGHEGRYQVSNKGRVRSLRYRTQWWDRPRPEPRILKPRLVSGYPAVVLSDRGASRNRSTRIHILVLNAFVGPRPSGFVCRHINGNPKDNRLENLAWGTQSENAFDAVRHGTRPRGESCSWAKLTAANVREIRRRYAAGPVTQYALADEYGVQVMTIHSLIVGKSWKHIK